MNKKTRSHRLIKEGAWIVLGQFMMVLGSLLSVRLLTEVLSPDAYGELALGMTVATLINQIILGPLSGGITRFYAPAAEHNDLSAFLNAAKKLVFNATGMILLLILISIISLILLARPQWIAITISALIFAILSGYCVIFSGIQTAARQRATVALHQGLEPLLRTIIAVGLLTWLGATSAIAMIGYAFASLLILTSQVFLFRKAIHIAPSNNTKKNWHEEIWKFSWPIGTFGVFTWLQLASDRWALQAFSTTSEVGNYAVLYQLGYYPISLITGMLMQFIVPILYQRAGDTSDVSRNRNATKLCWQLFWVTLAITGLAFLITINTHSLIFQIFVAKEYSTVSYLLPWMILSGGMFAAGQAIASDLLTKLKTRELIPTKIVTSTLGVTFNILGAHYFGISGVVYASMLFSIVYSICIVVIVINER